MTPERSPVRPNPDLGVAIDQDHLRSVQDSIIAWFAANQRDLPWRRTRDPWRILVSEILLQQIQVVRAIPFYDAFLNRFLTVADLADAPLADAIRVWGDLGRYRRLPNPHRTARLIVSDHGGVVPSDPAILRTLPGVGPYTAGAVACLAFEQDVRLVDTNIRRVLHRLFIGVDVPRRSATEVDIVRLAAAAVPRGHGLGLESRGDGVRRPPLHGTPPGLRTLPAPLRLLILSGHHRRPGRRPGGAQGIAPPLRGIQSLSSRARPREPPRALHRDRRRARYRPCRTR